jgi:hypothetical protein
MLDRRERERTVRQDLRVGKVSIFAGDNPGGLHHLEISTNSGRVFSVNGKTYSGWKYVNEFRPPKSLVVDPRAVGKAYDSYLQTNRDLLLTGAQLRPLDHTETQKLLRLRQRQFVLLAVIAFITSGLCLMTGLAFASTAHDRNLEAQLGRGMFLVFAFAGGRLFVMIGWRAFGLMIDAAHSEVLSAPIPAGGVLEVLPKSGHLWNLTVASGASR